MENLQRLLLSELGIPAWQLVLFVGLISFFILTYRVRVGLIATYLLVLYWNYYVFRDYLYSVASGNFLALIAYVLFGLALAGLSLYTCFYFRESGHIPGFPGFEISRLRGIFLKRIEKMELAVLEAEAKTINEVREFNYLRQKVEDRFLPLEAQLQRIEEACGSRESIFEGLETRQTAQIRALEDQLREGENLRETQLREAEKLRTELEARVSGLLTQTQEREEVSSAEDRPFKEMEEKLTARIHELEIELKEKEKLTEALHAEDNDRGPKAAEYAFALEALLEAQEKSFGRRAASFQEVIESLSDRICQLERQLKEKESLSGPFFHPLRTE